MGAERVYIDEFIRWNTRGYIDRPKLRDNNRNLTLSNWSKTKGSQNIPVMANALFADSKSWEFFKKYFDWNEDVLFLDYEGPISRMKTPWIVAAIAYAHDKMPSKLGDRAGEFLERLFVFSSLMAIPGTFVNNRDGYSVICAGPRSPLSESKDHAFNDQFSLVLNPSVRNNFRGQSKYWSSETFRRSGGTTLISRDAKDLMRLVASSHSARKLPEHARDELERKYLSRLKIDNYYIARYTDSLYSFYPSNENKWEQPVSVAAYKKGMSAVWPDFDVGPRPRPLGGSIQFEQYRGDGSVTVVSEYANKYLRTVLPSRNEMVYSFYINKHGYWLTRGEDVA